MKRPKFFTYRPLSKPANFDVCKKADSKAEIDVGLQNLRLTVTLILCLRSFRHRTNFHVPNSKTKGKRSLCMRKLQPSKLVNSQKTELNVHQIVTVIYRPALFPSPLVQNFFTQTHVVSEKRYRLFSHKKVWWDLQNAFVLLRISAGRDQKTQGVFAAARMAP